MKEITDHAQRLKERLPRHIDGADKFNKLLDILGGRAQGIEAQLFKFVNERSLSTAKGKQLDGIGQILNLGREVGQTDDSYRSDLVGVTGALSLSGQIEVLIDAYARLASAVTVSVFEVYPASVQLTAHFDGDPVSPTIDQGIIDAMGKVKAAGVALDLRYTAETDNFLFSNEADVSGNGPSDPLHGFGDETLTEGGSLARKL